MRVRSLKGISIGSVVFAGLTVVTNIQTDRQTDRQTDHTMSRHLYIAIARIYHSPL